MDDATSTAGSFLDVWNSMTAQEQEKQYKKILLILGKKYTGALKNSEIEELAHKALILALTGQRTYPKDLPPLVFVIGIARSVISHDFEKAQRQESLEDLLELLALLEDGKHSIDDLPCIFTRRDEEKQRISALYVKDLIDLDDELIYKMVDLILADYLLKPKQMAEMLNVNISDVINAKKRLARKLDSLKKAG